MARPDTRLTRAFTGRLARGIVNRFLLDHDGAAPAAYPYVHHLTSPLRAAARRTADVESMHLWAGQAHPLIRRLPAADLVDRLSAEIDTAVTSLAARILT
ncbi:MAG TPA: nitronate monooxygenase [Streptosporangiaceae bacterium]